MNRLDKLIGSTFPTIEQHIENRCYTCLKFTEKFVLVRIHGNKYVTWGYTKQDNSVSEWTYYGHYFTTVDEALADFNDRVNGNN